MNKYTIKLRNIARACGLTRLVRSLFASRDYEEHFHNALMGGIREGGIVWDIGANVGFYTTLFADLVGANGRVFAFEPSPGAAAKIEENAKEYPMVTVINKALSDAPSEAHFDVSSGEDSVTNHLVGESDGSNTVPVVVTTGDAMSKELGVPEVIKIDVEGFEYEVLQGMKELLA